MLHWEPFGGGGGGPPPTGGFAPVVPWAKTGPAHGCLYRHVPLCSYAKLIGQWLNGGMLQNVFTVRYQRLTCPPTSVVALSVITWSVFTCLPLLEERRFSYIEERNYAKDTRSISVWLKHNTLQLRVFFVNSMQNFVKLYGNELFTFILCYVMLFYFIQI
jgi:hypothetical protein